MVALKWILPSNEDVPTTSVMHTRGQDSKVLGT